MKEKNEHPASFLNQQNTSPPLRFFLETSHLKHLYRQGWLHRALAEEKCESVAEHTFSAAQLALFLCDTEFQDLDTARVLRLVLLHDLGEIHAGDHTPLDAIHRQEKRRREQESLSKTLRGAAVESLYTDLWKEYENGGSPEARFVRQVEKLEMALQALLYHKQYGIESAEFFRSARSAIQDPRLLKILEEAERLTQSPPSKE